MNESAAASLIELGDTENVTTARRSLDSICTWAISLIGLIILTNASALAQWSTKGPETACGELPEPISYLQVPGKPFQVIPAGRACYAFVSLLGENGSSQAGVAVIRRGGGASVVRVVPLEGYPAGMVLTHDGHMLIVAAGDRVAFLDSDKLLSASASAVLGYLQDAEAGSIQANVTRDDHYLFLSDEDAGTIRVVDLGKARRANFGESGIVGNIPVGDAPIALSFSPNGRYLYTTTQEAPSTYGWPLACRPQGGDSTQPPNHTRGAILVIDVARALIDPAHSVVSAVAAGCNPVRLQISVAGDIAFVTARSDNQLLAFDTARLLDDTAHALIGRVPVGPAPVGITVIDDGSKIVVANSNRFAGDAAEQFLTVVDVSRVSQGSAAVLGTIPAGAFPRELTLDPDGRTLYLTNFASHSVEIIDLTRVQFDPVRF